MLSELYAYVTAFSPQYVRHMGYLDEAHAMRSRFRRNQEAWRPHLEHTRRFVLSVAEKVRDRNKAVVFGAGLLLDVPLGELSSLFQEVVLVDIVFLPEARRRMKRYGNVKPLLHDVTNTAKQLYENSLRAIPALPEPAAVFPELDEQVGLVVSLNVLSQLWVVPRSYALRKFSGIDEEYVDDWCRLTVESHYAFLRSMPCDVCLVADYAFVKRDRQGDVVGHGSTISGLALPEPDASWTWNIMPIDGGRQHLSKELNVGAWHWQTEDRADRISRTECEESHVRRSLNRISD